MAASSLKSSAPGYQSAGALVQNPLKGCRAADSCRVLVHVSGARVPTLLVGSVASTTPGPFGAIFWLHWPPAFLLSYYKSLIWEQADTASYGMILYVVP
jgi:hypothetical protein